MQNDIAEIKLRAERRAGELLAERDKAKGHKFQPILKPGGSTMEPPSLENLGITKQQSHRWQLEAEVDPPTWVWRIEFIIIKFSGTVLYQTLCPGGEWRCARFPN